MLLGLQADATATVDGGGTNGSGKTTLVKRHLGNFKEKIPIINPDEIAHRMNPDDVSRVAIKAGMEAIRQQNAFLDSKENFGIETTFSGKREIKLIEKANSLGYKTNLVYVGLDSSKDNLTRVKARVVRGGHDIPVKDIERRYERSMKNLPGALLKVNRAFVLDNSGRKYSLKLVMENGCVKSKSPKMPPWCKRYIPMGILTRGQGRKR